MSFSTPLGIASVSYVLKVMLDAGLVIRNVPVSNVTVSVLPPDKAELADDENRLNVFMYMATPNPGWRNNMLPSRDDKGEPVKNQPLALDLHYLLSAYGKEELMDDILLGFGMQVLHDNPVLSKGIINNALAINSLPANLKTLATSDLANQIEYIRITPEILNTEEISRLWAAFGAKYRTSTAYKVTVVWMQSKRPSKTALPVKQRNLYVMPFNQPVIEKIASMASETAIPLENQKILETHWLELQGYQLKGEIVRVQIDNETIKPEDKYIEADKIRFALPINALKAGIQVVQVIHKMKMGSPPEPHSGVTSNAAVFLLSPSFNQTPDIVPTSPAGATAIRLRTISPKIRANQKVEVLLNEITTGNAVSKAYQFQAPANSLPAGNAQIDTIVIPFNNVATGDYMVRLKVDNAESPLDFPPLNNQKITIP